jgi:phosphoadenosine phosphosulfate reductase
MLFDTPFYVAYSGGKDSDALRLLFEMAGAPYELYHSHTTVDAPETVYYVRGIVPPENIHYPKKSMWELIRDNSMPPTRTVRYCCSALKETGGKGRFVALGVRWAESPSRRTRGSLEIVRSRRDISLMLNVDNAEDRRLFETCALKGKRFVNPIIDWSDDDVWAFLDSQGCKSNPLYAEGWKRIGCVGCPMASIGHRAKDFARWPKYYALYVRAFDRMVKGYKYQSTRTGSDPAKMWKTGQDVMDWWMQG